MLVAVLLAVAGVASASAAEPRPGVYMLDEDFAGGSTGAAQGAAAAGVQEVRKDFLWRSIESRPSEFDWSATDRAVAGTAAAGLDLMPTLVTTPPWAIGREDEPIPGVFPPADPAPYAAFARAAVERYGPGGTFWAQRPELPVRPVRTWQIWNEPNLPAFWRPAPDPGAYTALLKAAATAIRTIDPGAEIVMAGLPESLGGENPGRYLGGVYAAGGAPFFDTLAVHPYAPDVAAMVAASTQLRRVADGYGDTATPLRITEFGWATDGEPSLFTTDEATQAALVGDSLVALRAAAEQLKLEGFFYFKWRDHPRPAMARDIWPYHAGLRRRDGSDKPALAAFTRGLTAPLPVAPAPGAAPGRPPAAPGSTVLHVHGRVWRQSAGRVRRRGLKLRAGCSRACAASLVVTLETRGTKRWVRRVIARRAATLRAVTGRTVAVRLAATDLRRARSRRARLVVRISATSDGQAASVAPITLRHTRDGFGPVRP